MSGDIVDRLRAEVVPCPGKGWDGNGVQHCAECCFGTGVDAATADELRVMVLARDAADTIKNLTAEVERLRAERDDHKARLAVEAVTAPDADYDTMMDSLQARLRDLHAEVERLRLWKGVLIAAGESLAKSLAKFHDPQDDLRLLAWQEARREQ